MSHVSPQCSQISVLQLFLLIVNINCVTPRTRIPLEKLTVPQLVVTFPTMYGSRKFIAVFTTARRFSLY
jgi:hypothetical protein